MDVTEPPALGGLIEGLVEFLDETPEMEDGAHAIVTEMRLEIPIELHVGAEPRSSLAGRTPERTATSFAPVLHQLKLRVEVEGAGGIEPRVEP